MQDRPTLPGRNARPHAFIETPPSFRDRPVNFPEWSDRHVGHVRFVSWIEDRKGLIPYDPSAGDV